MIVVQITLLNNNKDHQLLAVLQYKNSNQQKTFPTFNLKQNHDGRQPTSNK